MYRQTVGARGAWAAAWVVLGACGAPAEDGGRNAPGGGGAETGVIQPQGGAGGSSGGAGGSAGTGTGVAGAGSGGASGDPGAGNGGAGGAGSGGADAGTGAAGGGGSGTVDECADPRLNDCGSATCVDTPEGFSCECDGGATFADGACACDLVGTFAVRTVAPLSWDAAMFGLDTAIAAGTADSTGYGLLTITRDGSGLHAESTSCGSDAPDLCSPFFMEAYGQSFPTAIWDAATMPTTTVTLETMDEAPGGTFSSPPSAAFLGLRFASGVDPLGAFPSSATSSSLVWTDDDDDGPLGVTSLVKAPGGSSTRCSYDYAYLPIDPLDFDMRATKLEVGARTISHIDGTIDDCDTLSGQLITDSVNGRVRGCTRVDGNPCSTTQSEFLDMQQQTQQIGTAEFTMVRLDTADPTCADARGAPFP